MTDVQQLESRGGEAGRSRFERLLRRSGLALIAWSGRRVVRREEVPEMSSADSAGKVGILDPSVPQAVRRFGFPPGIFR
jgi:hypothetical protein